MSLDFAALNYVATPMFVVVRKDHGDWAIRFLNLAHIENAGIPFDGKTDMPIRELFPEGVAEALISNYELGAAAQGPFTYEETLVLGGVERRFRTTLRRIPSEDGPEGCALMGTAVDITSVVETQKKEVLARIESERMMALAAHDLRGPLRRLGQIHDMLIDGFVDQGDGKMDLLEIMGTVVEKSDAYLSKIILFVEGSDIGASHQTVDIRRIVRDTLHLFDPDGEAKFTMNVSTLVADPVIIEILLRNFVDNSFKYANVDQLAFDIFISECEQGFLKIVLSDNGVGYGGRRVLAAKATEEAVGSGYGLPTIYKIVTARGGTAKVITSTFGQGAALELTLRGQLVSDVKLSA